MAVAEGGSRNFLPLPANIPTGTRCIQLELPDDPAYFQLFYGALDALTNWFSYDRDLARRGRLVANLWKRAVKSIRPCSPPKPPITFGGFFEEGFMSFRQDGCKLQVSVGVDPDTGEPCWCTIYDGSLCVNPGQPGAPQPQPKPGTCQNYTLKLNAAHTALVPVTVSTGDTVALVSAEGAGTDGTPLWYCPDGETFFAGACTGGCTHNSGDPLPTYCHMALVGNIGGTFFPLIDTPYTVPSGVSNAQVVLQVNDGMLSDNSGEYVVAVTVCRSSAALDWCANVDLALVSGPIVPSSEGDTPTPAGVWNAGLGWRSSAWVTSGIGRRGVVLNIATDTFTLTGMEWWGTYAIGGPDSITPVERMSVLHPGGDWYDAGTAYGAMPSPFDLSGTGIAGVTTVPNTVGLAIFVYTGDSNTGGDPGGDVVVNRVRVCGHGPVPSQLAPFLE